MKKLFLFALSLCLLAGCTTDTPTPPDDEPPVLEDEQPPEPKPLEVLGFIEPDGAEFSDAIHINQLGYRPDDLKRAVIPQEYDTFSIVRMSDGAIVYEGTASDLMDSPASDEVVRFVDFSSIAEPGEYIVYVSGSRSFPFMIGENVYSDVRRALLDFFHYQKCGDPLDAGVWSHPGCHLTEAYVLDTNGDETGETKDASGGWHDAGDFGRYTVPSAQSIAQLLWAYELAPNPSQDMLEIVWYKIEWMLKMQDDATGGVYHKVTCKSFPALNIMPEQETGKLVLSPISPTATADFAASLAMAARFYPEHRDLLLAAAERAWEWCVANPNAPGFKNPRGVVTGEYGDSDSSDERFWAATELFIATGNEKYHDYIKTAELSTGLGWSRMGTFGLIAYLFHAGDNADDDLYRRMELRLLAHAIEIYERYSIDPYGVSLGTNYHWGSNMSVSNNAVTLLLAGFFDESVRESYTKAALDHMHYLLGKNPLSQGYVTGFGSNPAMNPHHRPSVAKGQTVPGMVVGGPNRNTSNDPTLRRERDGYPPSKAYIDHIDSYASNEVTIYWNSPMYLAAALLDF
jgi:endoglucanase